MLFDILFLLALLHSYVLALPMSHGHSRQRDHRLIKRSSFFNSSESGILDLLFPNGQGSSVWATTDSISNAVELAMDSFNPKDALSRAQPDFSKAPDGSSAMEISFKKGAYDYKGPEGGISFYARPTDLSNAKEVTFSYSLYFQDGFQFNKGGKLPGLYGGDDEDESISCSGGRHFSRCFSARYMFREDGKGELYTYFPSEGDQFSGNKQLCDVPPLSDCNPDYGASVARGSWKWATGEWTTVSQRLKLNDAGKQNGELEVKANGKTVINLKGLAYRPDDKGRFQGIQMQSFFGGHETDWASPQDQSIWTKDYALAVTEEF